MLRTILFSFAICITFGSVAFSQQSYEFMIITTTGNSLIITDKKIQTTETCTDKGCAYIELMKKVEQLTKDGWEVLAVTDANSIYQVTGSSAYQYHLRRRLD